MSRVPNNCLVVVADGAKALLLRAKTDRHGVLTLHEEETFTQGDQPLQGPSGARPEEQTVKQTSEASFANHLAKRVEQLVKSGHASDLVVVADPRTLGELRSAMHKSVSEKVAFTLSKDLTKHTVADIAKALH